MANVLLVGNLVYFAIDKNWNDKSEQKYIAGDMNGNIYMNQIYTKADLDAKHADLVNCKGILGVVEEYKK